MYATLNDLNVLFRPIKPSEEDRASMLLEVVSDQLRMAAKNVDKDIDCMIEDGDILVSVLKSVVCDVVGRCLSTPTDEAPMSQVTQSALGYSVSGTYLVPGGGVWIKKSELARLGLKRQRIGVIEPYAD